MPMSRSCIYRVVIILLLLVGVFISFFEPHARLKDSSLIILYDTQEDSHTVTMDISELRLRYYYYTGWNTTDFFEHCKLTAYTKEAMEVYLIQQLKQNKLNLRTYDCSDADIYVIPMTLGNGARGGCGNQNNMRKYARLLSYDIFENPASCWNTQPSSRSKHFIIAGDAYGRMEINRHHDTYNLWVKHFIAASTWVTKGPRAPSFPCTVGTGFESIAAEYAFTHDDSMRTFHPNIVLDTKYEANFTYPEYYINNTLAWTDRPYRLFFMGQTTATHHGYKMRRVAAESVAIARDEKNVFVQVSKRKNDTLYFDECNEDSWRMPCTMIGGGNARTYIDLLSKSQFNLMFRGDNPCSNRFSDAISLNVINIVISDQFDDCLWGQYTVPWKKMYIQIAEKQFAHNPQKAIEDALSGYTEKDFQDMLQLIEKYKKYILWHMMESKTSYVVLKDAINKCVEKKQWR